MEEVLICATCYEELRSIDEPIRRGDRVYCCEACAFEASRSVDCEGRADLYAHSIVEKVQSWNLEPSTHATGG